MGHNCLIFQVFSTNILNSGIFLPPKYFLPFLDNYQIFKMSCMGVIGLKCHRSVFWGKAIGSLFALFGHCKSRGSLPLAWSTILLAQHRNDTSLTLVLSWGPELNKGSNCLRLTFMMWCDLRNWCREAAPLGFYTVRHFPLSWPRCHWQAVHGPLGLLLGLGLHGTCNRKPRSKIKNRYKIWIWFF